MNIIGSVVLIRSIEENDLDFLRKMMNDPAVESQTLDLHFPISAKAQKAWYESFDERKEFRCIIENKEKSEPIGYISITDIDYRNQCAIVGIKMETFGQFRIQGDMDEIFSLMKQFCFDEMNLQRLEAYVLETNLLSIRNLTVHGFQQEGVLKRKIFKHGKWNDVVIFALLKEFR